MRAHHLEITAFGPFPDTVEVDLDELAEPGLFLLTGPTGAGKTSVLDAICFALYGAVPGDRNTAGRLRCDTAPVGRAPRVVLEATLAGRRFRFTRSPAWRRPKKRGEGTTSEQASVSVHERVDGSWVHLTGRIDEAGHLVSELLGMNVTQFCQVAMLPQGEFQTFLRASSKDRHALLQQLFRTRRFEDMEKWLRERRTEARRDNERRCDQVATVLHRMSETAAVDWPEGWEQGSLATLAADGQLADETGRWVGEAAAAARAAEAEAAVTVRRARIAEEAHARAARLADEQQRLRRATAEDAALRAEADVIEEKRTVSSRAHRAAPVLSLLRVHRDAQRAFETKDERAVAKASAAAARLGMFAVDRTDVDAALARARDRVREAEESRKDARRITELDGTLTDLDQQIADTTAIVQELGERSRVLPGHLDQLRDDLSGAEQAAGALPIAQDAVGRYQERRRAAVRATTLYAELRYAQEDLQRAVEAQQEAKETWLGIRESRLNGMAAELATRLAAGADCPVCGSHDHPSLAVPSPGAPGPQQERRARKRLDDAESTLQAHREKVSSLESEVVRAESTAREGQPAGHREGRVDEALISVLKSDEDGARARVNSLRESADRRDRLRGELASAVRESDRLIEDRRQADARLASATAERTTTARERDRLAAELRRVLDTGGVESVDSLAERWSGEVALLDAASQALADREQAEEHARRAATQVQECASEHGFTSLEDAESAGLPATRLAEIDDELRRHDERRYAVGATLEDPELTAAGRHPVPDLTAIRAAAAEAAQHARDVGSRAAVTHGRSTRLTGLNDDLGEQLAAWEPVRGRFTTLDRLVGMVDGTSPDNPWRMRLSAYVLAYRLTQVVDAANARLVRMSGARYTLEHTGDRGAGENRGGLSLLLRDAWSGLTRDPVTLSGGETFVVSLALALGLADVVTQEAGGADIDTLFVDEGFGALDGETLDDVMDTLDTLREGGRVVGLVSHVAELRSRIPAQLQVSKEQHGSTLAMRSIPT